MLEVSRKFCCILSNVKSNILYVNKIHGIKEFMAYKARIGPEGEMGSDKEF